MTTARKSAAKSAGSTGVSHADRVARSVALLDELEALWPGLRRLDKTTRKNHPGLAMFALLPQARLLLGILTAPSGGDANRAALVKSFDAFGASDGGDDPARFEADLLARRLDEVEAMQGVADRMTALARALNDDALVGAAVVLPAVTSGLGHARNLAKSLPAYRSLLAPLLDSLRAMTDATRAHKNKKPA